MATKGGLLSGLQLKHWIKAAVPLTASDGGGVKFSLSGAGNATWVLRYRHGTQRPEMTAVAAGWPCPDRNSGADCRLGHRCLGHDALVLPRRSHAVH